MPIIDPESPREHGLDCNNRPVSLGDTDSDGFFVGWIDENGQSWESRQERDVAIGAGRCLDAWGEWNRSGGVLGPEPDWMAIIRAHDVLPQHEDEAYRDFREMLHIRMVHVQSHYIPAVQKRAMLN